MEIGEKLSGRYQITNTIGQGGMANVFLAHDLILDRDVAVKVLRFDFQDNQDAIRRFQREAMSASQLLHHNIVEIYDVDEEQDQQYIVMEYVKGTDLKTYIKENAPLNLELVVSIMSQILSAIEVAHRHRIIHRDIKPQNILITDKNEVKITDFGIAIALTDTSITQTNTLLGSVHYLSPEQARGANATTKSDIYALGVVLFELITGSVPFDGESAVSVALKHFQESFPRIKTKMEYVPQALENVVLKATAKDPKDRYKTVQEMLNDLSTSLNPNRMNEELFQPRKDLQDTVILQPIKPIPSKNGSKPVLQAPEPLDDQYPRYDTVKPITPKKQHFSWIWKLMGLLLTLAVIGGFAFGVIQMTSHVSVPDLSGKSLQEAKELLAKDNLQVGAVKQAWHDTITPGQIIESNPKSGKRVAKNSKIDIVVSDGKEQVELANYVGKDYETIRSSLTEAGFIVERRGMATTPDKVGVILDQNVPAGSKVVPSDTPITLTVGNASDSIQMQDFYNLSEEMVNTFAEEYGLTVEPTYEFSDFIPKGQVISQSPESGTPLTAGQAISVVVSKGPEKEQVASATVNIPIEYLPRYSEQDTQKKKPLPNKIQVFIGDKKNKITNVADEFEITESRTVQLMLYIPTDGVGQYRILRDGEIIAESNEVYPN
ncbi:Stk1 family PASTA domain-containing Ser/Thr kinase [Vaginisenegalia massiliensis]|uniref:Stk1 family PASTA domain-containing Ser/Thr kinase n=1 Tax=Vaginisenegalia massiliensis TaxID=2058294 RepID=UPI001F15665F|nr:Stk1 family PASTA domain-containing Ser/Thr kinase [Vaginisenegalia massiliensis]